MTEPLWHTANVSEELAQRVANQHQIPQRVAKWMLSRHISEDVIASWLHPSQTAPISPYVFREMQIAVQRVIEAHRRKEHVCIVGDYDVDGVTSSTIMGSCLEALGVTWSCLIPHRVEDGYGLSLELVERTRDLGCQLIITVDNGIRAHEAILAAAASGIDVIITDHHEPGEELPSPVVACIHHVLANSDCAAALSGAGVAQLFAEALLNAVDNDDSELRNWHVGLAGLGALADIMPMTLENRRLVQAGLEYLRGCTRPGWLALCNAAGVTPNSMTDTVALWSITPRLNAAGRIGSADKAFDLLMTSNDVVAEQLANQLEEWNAARKTQTEAVFQEACQQHMVLDPAGTTPIIVVSGNWNLGVVGIAAAKLVGHFGVPAIVFADDGSGLLRGSGRAPDGFPLHDAVGSCREFLVHFGGHEVAIGCAVEKSNLGKFRNQVTNIATGLTQSIPAVDGPIADDFLPLAEANLDLVDWVRKMAPFGPNHPEYKFYVGPVQLVRTVALGKGRHVRLRVREGKAEVELIWFNAPDYVHDWRVGCSIAVLIHLDTNTWKGRTTVQMRVADGYLLENPLLREDFGYLYRLLQSRRKLAITDLEHAVPGRAIRDAVLVADAFVELGFAERSESAYHVVEQVVPCDLRHSRSYQNHLRQASVQKL